MSKTKLQARPRFRSCAVCIRNSSAQTEILLVKMLDPHSKSEFWVPPGGGIEPEETSLEAALRETLEETGEKVIVVSDSPVMARYEFSWNGKIHDCQTDFHLCRPVCPGVAPEPVEDASYLIESKWFPVPEALERLKFHETIYEAVKATLARRSPVDP